MHTIVDGELHRYSVFTALCIVEDVIHLLARSISHSVSWPGKDLTCDHCHIGMHTIVDGKLQRYSVFTALCIVEDVIHLLARSIGHSVSWPGKALTCYHCRIGMHTIVYATLYRYSVFTALSIVEDVIHLLARSIGHSVSWPGKSLTCYHCRIGMHTIVDGELHCYSVVRECCVLEDVIDLLARSIGHSVSWPGKALTC